MLLHWLVALLIFAGFTVGHVMEGMATSPEKLKLVNAHKWVGITVLLLAVLRVVWRLTHAAPPLPATMPSWQRWAAQIGHVGLYALMFLIPLSGWLMSSAAGYQVVYFGVLPLPDLIGKSESLARTFGGLHGLLNTILVVLLFAHIGAALKHAFIDRDDIVARMVPGSRKAATHAGAMLGVIGLIVLVAVLVFGEGEEHDTAQEASPQAAAPSAETTPPGALTARFTQMGVGVDAAFTRYSVDLDFDPAQPEQGSVTVRVDTASFDIGDAEYNRDVIGSDWLDAAQFPEARVESSAMRATASGFEADGQFTLKGVTQPLTIPFAPVDGPDGSRLEGVFSISRKAFGVGDPDWDDSVEDQVEIRFSVPPKS